MNSLGREGQDRRGRRPLPLYLDVGFSGGVGEEQAPPLPISIFYLKVFEGMTGSSGTSVPTDCTHVGKENLSAVQMLPH